MAKSLTFYENDILTPTIMNTLVQDSQVVNTTGTSMTDIMSQNAVGLYYIAKSSITSSKGTNTTLVLSQGGVSANYIAKTDTIAATSINFYNPNGYFGGETNLQSILEYIGKVFSGSQTVTKLCANTFDAK